MIGLAKVVPILASVVAILAAVTDIYGRRIPNRITYPAMMAGLALQACVHGWHGLVSGLEGGLLFGGIFLVFHLMRTMGAGDVKLAAALGCILGPAGALQVMFATALAGGVLGIMVMVAAGRVLQTLRSTLSVIGFHFVHGLRTHPTANLDNPAALRMPYGVAFAVGTIYCAVFIQLGR